MSKSTNSEQSSIIFSDDPYDRFIRDENKSKNLIPNDRSSKFSRKYEHFKQELSAKSTYFIYGGMQGAAIGALAGFGIGVVTAFQTKRFVTIPLSMVGSAFFFSAVMAFGSLIRSADVEYMSTSFSEDMTADNLQKMRKLINEAQYKLQI